MSNNHLIVGLGGTGGKVIRQLRKTLERNKDAQGKTPTDARFDYLYVDTSSDELDKKEEWKVLGKEIDLARSQYLINTASGVRPVLGDPDSFPGLKNWIEPRHVFDFVNASTAGAAQRRKLGRVVLRKMQPALSKLSRIGFRYLNPRLAAEKAQSSISYAAWLVAREVAR